MKQPLYGLGAPVSRDNVVITSVRKFIAQLKENGEKVPGYQNRPFYRVIAERAGLRYEQLKRNKEARKELDKASERLGLAPYTGTKYQEIKAKIVDYAEGKKKSGETIPSDPRKPTRPSHVGAAYEMGVDYREWSRSACISKFATEQLRGLPLGDPFEPSPGTERVFSDSYYERLEDFQNYLQSYETSETPMPESLARPGYPNYVAIQSDYANFSKFRISRNRLTLDTEFRRSLMETIAKVGLEPKLKPIALRITWAELLEFAPQSRRRETKDTATSHQSARNLVSAGSQFMRFTGRSGADWCDVDLTTSLDANLDAWTASRPEGTARKLRAEIRSLAQYRTELLKKKELPSTFPLALKELCERAGVPYAFVEHRLGLPKGTVGRWAYDLSMPSPSSLDVVKKLEQFFELSEGLLVALLPRTFGRRVKAGAPALSKLYGSHVVRHLPHDFAERPPEEQEMIVQQVRQSLLTQDRAYSAKHGALTKDRYALKLAAWPHHAIAEWSELKDFKQSELPPLDKERTLNAIWDDQTSKLSLDRLERVYGFATLSTDRGGLSLPIEAVGLSILASYEVMYKYVKWCQDRRGNKLGKADYKFLYLVASFLRKKFGPIYQMPDLASRLRPFEGVISASFVKAAQEDWQGTCAGTEARLRDLAKQVESRSVQTRDPFEPIAGLLNSKHPRAEYKRLILTMDEDCPDVQTSPAYYHTHVRNRLMMRLSWTLVFRAKNMRQMTYRADNKGQLRKEDGVWVVEMPRLNFKNKNSQFFGPKGNKRDFRQILQDKDGLYELIETYVALSRPFLMDGKENDVLLVSLGGAALNGQVYGQTFRNVTAKYFAYNPHTGTGMPGVMPHGPHAMRHVIATDIVKNTGRFDLAAYALQDSEQEVRKTYARFLIEDKHRLVAEFLDQDSSLEDVGRPPSKSTPTSSEFVSKSDYELLLAAKRELEARVATLEAQQIYGQHRAA